MTNKHTQGTFYAKDGQIIIEETGKTIAVIPYFDNESEEQKANQQLFAAAPQLLEVLNKINLALLLSSELDKSYWSKIAQQAINKATK